MVIALANARVLTPDEEIPRATVILEEGCIAPVGEGLPPPAGAQIMVLDGLKLAPGFDADLVALDEGLEVAMTFVGGELAFSRPKGSAT